MASDSKIQTAMKYAKNGGVLVTDFLGTMKSVNLGTEGGQDRANKIFRDHPEIVVGVYQVNNHLDEDEVELYLRSDAMGLQ